MSIARLYHMTAPEGAAEALQSALEGLAAQVRPIPGCQGVELLQDVDTPHHFTFIEKWESIEAHKASSAHLSKETLKPVMGALAGPPEGAYLACLLTS